MKPVGKRRFIAGANCPECSKNDTLFVYADALNDVVECAECGFQQGPPEPATAEVPQHDIAEPVKFIDASKDS